MQIKRREQAAAAAVVVTRPFVAHRENSSELIIWHFITLQGKLLIIYSCK